MPTDKPTTARMRAALKARKGNETNTLSKALGINLGDVGADEAPDLPVKSYLDPDRGTPMNLHTGGVTLPNGQLLPPTGLQGLQQQQQAAPQGAQATPPGAPPGIPPAALAMMSGAQPSPAPQVPSNILALTRAGQAMNAMRPPAAPPRPMAKGGSVKSKYQPGQHVYTEWTQANNHEPMKILSTKGQTYRVEHHVGDHRMEYDLPEHAIKGAVGA